MMLQGPLSNPGPLLANYQRQATQDTVKDEPRTLGNLLESVIQSHPNTPLVGYPRDPSSPSSYAFHTPRQLDNYARNATHMLASRGLTPNKSQKTEKVVAILAPSDFNYVVTIFALVRMRVSILLLSNRLPTEAYINLLEKTKCNHIVVSKPLKPLAQSLALERRISIHDMPSESDFMNDIIAPEVDVPAEEESAGNRTAFIIHSSGSTGLPKPIFQTHRACLGNYTSGNGYRAFVTLPLFHNHGLSTFFRAVCTCSPVALYNAALPLTASNLIAAMEYVKPESFHGVPYALKLLAEQSRGIELLAQCKLVLFGGSSCPDDLGDKLVNAGVYLVAHYGATEIGQLMTSFREKEDKAWNYVRPLPVVQPYLSFVPADNNTFELVVLDGCKTKVSSNSNDPPDSFHTSDLFSPHSTIPNAWKYLGRNDDRITLVNGEKVLPIPFEHHLRRDPLIKEALLFGVGRALPGLLLIPSVKAKDMTRDKFLQAVWPRIQSANAKAEAFGRISQDMVEILDVDVEYPATDKGTIIRAASYRKFADLIEQAYRRFEGDAESDASAKLALDSAGLESFILDVFGDSAGIRLSPQDDFFNAGIDSLQAITIRGLLKRKLDLGGSDLGRNAIFEYPNAQSLASHLLSLRTGEGQEEKDEIQVMEELINKHSVFPKHTPGKREVVLLSGTTGSLGVHVLAQLLPIDNVKAIYCPVRASNDSVALDRIISTLSSKGLLPSHNIKKIVALASDFRRADLGFSVEVIDELKGSLTTVIHSAWAVNFNLGVRSFEDYHIKGISNLVKLCLSVERDRPANFFFCSSISAAAGTPLPATIAEAPIEKLDHAQNMGYARSKLVAERIVQAAAETTGMTAKVLRIGQIVGDTEKGIWNNTEAIPLMIQSAKTVGALPALDETPSWLPVDIVAKIVIDISTIRSSSPPSTELQDSSTVFHIQNPRLFDWTQDLLPALRSAGLQFETVSQSEWVRRLRESNSDPVQNPTVKLLDFFAEKYDNEKPGRKGLVFETRKTEAASVTLSGGFDVIGSGLIGKIVQEWLKLW
ncbi:hypothetical protein BDV96DRAFT_574148 [Lophiotrema nucula]|uniref:Carrier domain-containing protein n=1 Tax=Lophiotrema nucula TaxID=690887 RepID=A0A6A5ZDF3_9PLEO|nr:hypothetical protein BDV96DRAFT_574148 [Lophiotrema nucula]